MYRYHTCKIVYLILIILPILTFSQVDTAWVRRYNGPTNQDDKVYSLAIDGVGNVYVTGNSHGIGQDPSDMLTIKYDPNGNTLWEKRYNSIGNGYDKANAIAVDESGNVYIAGCTDIDTSSTVQNLDCCIIKYNIIGDTVWTRTYSYGQQYIDELFQALVLDAQNNIYVTGQSNFNNINNNDIITIKYNNNGDTVWVRRYGDYMNEHARVVTVDNQGNVYIGGGCDGHLILLKYALNGDLCWARDIPGYTLGLNYINAIRVDSSGDIYAAGSNASGYHNPTNYYFVVKYDSSGNQYWNRWPCGNTSCAYAIVVDAQGNAYVTGKSYNATTNNDYATIKYNTNGDTIWTKRYNGLGNGIDGANDIAIDEQNNVYVTGYSKGIGTQLGYATVKYNTNGTQQWVARFDNQGDSNAVAQRIKVDQNGNVYVSGYSIGQGTGFDYATIKYIQTEAIEENHEPLSIQPLVLNIYPNPMTALSVIRYSLPVKGNVSLQLFDISGRLVKTLVNEQKSAGNYSLIWNGTDDNHRKVGEGVYFCILKTDGKSLKQKILMVK